MSWLEDRVITHKFQLDNGAILLADFRATEDVPDIIVTEDGEAKHIGFLPSKCHVQIAGGRIEDAEYNPAFGQVVKSKYHRGELAKKHNLVEVGNENPKTIRDEFKKDKAAAVKKSWENI